MARDYRQFPTTLEAIVGRINRDVPLYFEMRRDRMARELEARPDQPDLYDDIAVAESRLGHQDLAIRWMAKKSALRLTDDQRYRMLSNLGTFRFLAWVKGGKKRLGLLDQAIQDIEAGLAINPNAHFGRERTQLSFMQWARAVQESRNPSPDHIIRHSWLNATADDIKGLTGLTDLGEVWESPDVMAALATALRGNTSLAYFALWRAEELLSVGKESLNSTDQDFHVGLPGLHKPDEDSVREQFVRQRREADRYRAAREEYELVRLRQGRHPDTDPAFWQDWDPPKFEFQEPMFSIKTRFIELGLVVLVFSLGAFWFSKRK